MNMVITFYGFMEERVDELMPTVVEVLGLDHPKYSVEVKDKLRIYDSDGKRIIPNLLMGEADQGIVISVPGFDKVREDLEETIGALRNVLGVPVATDSAVPSVAALDGNIY